MCKDCNQIDIRIRQLRRVQEPPGLDELSHAMIRMAIEALETDKAALKCGGIQREGKLPDGP
ncbi:hypothetical protein GCM10010987_60670 [Bradyrhizobium guangdongense]|uniref:Uncharacterized protein n=1 Tax=Bradyrhizobium guangdongense TaxID=1325090 RepID=A0A410UY16_9BRAD|nr:hypothetical protein X265_00590 [Bradyrhizobium guangdongense]QOZ57403.1 hypothetical protein XH86_00590 [Bradyrhizobium guangdongense]GGI30684.1 hypothetical protein GCM10010987_60670 [Bradyrhizobium guangdongense]